MPSSYPSMPDHMQEFIRKQPLFFVASAPLTGKHVNVSPKGHTSRTFAIMNDNQVAYVDGSGSGCETISHIYENGRVTVMFCSFVKAPRIIRLFCTGRVIERNNPEFRPMLLKMRDAGMKIELPDKEFHDRIEKAQSGESSSNGSSGDEGDEEEAGKKAKIPSDVDLRKDDGAGVLGARAIIVLDVWKAQKSCGFGVPLLMAGEDGTPQEASEEGGDAKTGNKASSNAAEEPKPARSQDIYDRISVQFDDQWDDRNTMSSWAMKMIGSGQLEKYRAANNTTSIDGLPGVKMVRTGRRHSAALHANAWARRTFLGQWQSVLVGFLLALLLQAAAFYTYTHLWL